MILFRLLDFRAGDLGMRWSLCRCFGANVYYITFGHMDPETYVPSSSWRTQLLPRSDPVAPKHQEFAPSRHLGRGLALGAWGLEFIGSSKGAILCYNCRMSTTVSLSITTHSHPYVTRVQLRDVWFNDCVGFC